MAGPEVKRAAWCAEAERALLPAAGCARHLEAIKADVKNDRTTELYRVTGTSAGWLVLRLEGTPLDELELVIVLGAGKGAAAVIPIIQSYAKRLGATVRTHVTRAGLVRMYEAHGFQRAEIVLKWRPTDGQ